MSSDDRKKLVKAMVKRGTTKTSTPRIYRAEDIVPRNVIPTGHETLDWGYGTGGMPSGRVITYYGRPGCGKTTLAIQDCINVQKRGGIAYYLDFENKFDMQYAFDLGLDPDFFIIDTPAHIEEGMRKFEDTVGTLRDADPDMPVVYVWDSVTSAKSKDTYESDWEDYNFAREARYYSDKLPKFCRMVSETNAVVIGITQKRMTSAGAGGMKNKVGPGHAWGHHTVAILEWRMSKRNVGNVSGDGEEVTILFSKNQCGPPFRQAKLYMEYGKGYDPYWSLLEHATKNGVVTRSGAWYSFMGTNFGQGKEKALKEIATNKDLESKIRAQVREEYTAIELGASQ